MKRRPKIEAAFLLKGSKGRFLFKLCKKVKNHY